VNLKRGIFEVKSSKGMGPFSKKPANDNPPTWTPAMVEARVNEAFAIDRRLPREGPTDGVSGALVIIKHLDGGTKGRLALRKQTRDLVSLSDEKVRSNPAAWSALCQRADAKIERVALKRAEESRMLEAFDWLVRPEKIAKLEFARQVVLCQQRSGLSSFAWCESTGVRPDDLRKWTILYCTALAARLNLVPRKRSPLSFRDRPDLVVGIEAISAELLRTPKNTRTMIEGGKLPVELIQGQPCASRKNLRPFKAHKAANDNRMRRSDAVIQLDLESPLAASMNRKRAAHAA
jgi:hypothetical protein